MNDLDYFGEQNGEYPYYIGIGTWTPPSTITEELSDDEALPLSYFETAIMICLLQDAINELIILKYVIGGPMTTWNFHYMTLTERFTRRLTPERLHPEVDSRPVMTPLLKLQKNREQIEVIFTKIIREMTYTGNYYPLEDALLSIQKEAEDDKYLIQELKLNVECMKELKTRVERKRKLDDIEEKERDEFLYFLQDELDDMILKCGVEKEFASTWENVRSLQNRWKHKIAEDNYKEQLENLRTQTAIEQRVTEDWQTFIKLNHADLEELLEEWMTRYDMELERTENKLLQLKYQKDQMAEKKVQLNNLYDNKVNEMRDWISFRNYRNARTKAILAIQSWWRGVMVRKKLTTRKKKGKKKKKDPF